MTEYLDDKRLLVSVYRSPRHEGMYLYVDRRVGVVQLPEALRTLFGVPQHSLDLLMTPERKLARASAADVLDAIARQGFYLQLPPQADAEMRAVAAANEKLTSR